MTQGVVTKLVRSFGSAWGRIRPAGEARDIFFNRASLARPADFDDLREGQRVSFVEHADPANGAIAAEVAASVTQAAV